MGKRLPAWIDMIGGPENFNPDAVYVFLAGGYSKQKGFDPVCFNGALPFRVDVRIYG